MLIQLKKEYKILKTVNKNHHIIFSSAYGHLNERKLRGIQESSNSTWYEVIKNERREVDNN